MNEIRYIHLGRQSYTIAADAYKDLREYMEAIKREAGAEVAEEVELRIAELLTERGVSNKKVILSKDVTFVQEQLGKPGDFSEVTDSEPRGEKRLFRDTDDALVAGVAAGLASYLRIDTVIVRLLFIALTFFWGTGVLLYVILWLLVPPARTSSDRLQMQGLSVNVENIKEAVAQADVGGAARRVSGLFARIVSRLVKLLLTLSGIGLVFTGTVGILGAAIVLVFGLAHGLQIGAKTLFPVGSEQVTILICGVVIMMLIGGMVSTIGVALVRRRWTVPGWALAAVVAVFVVVVALGGGLGADAAPRLRQQYQGLQHSRYISIQPFTQLNFLGNDVFYVTQPGPTAGVEIRTLGNVDTSAISVTEKNGELTVDTTKLHPTEGCGIICPFGITNTEVVITTPYHDSVSQTAPFNSTFDSHVTLYGTGGRQ